MSRVDCEYLSDWMSFKKGFGYMKKKVVVGTIKVAGGYDVEVKLYPEVSTKMKVVIVPKQ